MMSDAHAAIAPMAFWTSAVAWFGMMAAMMAPTMWPWVRSFHRFGGSHASSGVVATGQFAAGYLFTWFWYALAAAALEVAFHGARAIAPLIFVVAGVYQFVPLKRACLTHCRSPLSFFLARWRNGPAGAFRLGVEHGVYCVGCCWALMATAIAVGVMNLWWMAALAAVAFVEQVAPRGRALRVPLGVALLAAGLWQFGAGG